MAINIRNREAERLARQLAEVTGDSITGAIVVALKERLASVRAASAAGTPAQTERLARLLGSSQYVAGLLTRTPEALRLLARDEELVPRPVASLTAAWTASVGRAADAAEGVRVLRGLRRTELLRIACADLLGEAIVRHTEDWHMLQRIFVDDLDDRAAPEPSTSAVTS